ncbi:hypothetical protein [Methylobacterium oryzae]|uniref:hypothetical protein n=1 Tax=Methylobacterium oryzae TaxID=334852 RepID=UPI001F1AB309|nr:hypothetical protein [Methylobacterium oryzae]UIN36391.1 hypothetical protein LXM90_07810 [Methylobacterium oryzae]
MAITTHQPTELELRLVAEREAADAAARAAIEGQRQKAYAAREAAIQAERERKAEHVVAVDPSRNAASLVRRALGADWAPFVSFLRSADPARLKALLLSIEATEDANRQAAQVRETYAETRTVQIETAATAQAALERRAEGLAV